MLTTGTMVALAPSAAAADITPRNLTITVTNLGPEHRTCQIDADLYIPAGVTATSRAPALLVTNGFGGTKDDQADLAQGFGAHGYVTLSYTGIGFVDGDTCPITLDDREHDGAAASQLLRFLGGDSSIRAVDDNSGQRVTVNQVIRQDATTGTVYDPAVGMTGGSYGGQIQFATAAYERGRGTNRVDAIIPLITWNDLAYSLDPNSAAGAREVPGAFKWQWSNGFYLLGEGQPLLEPNLDPSRINSLTCLHFVSEACATVRTLNSGSYPADRTGPLLDYAHSVSPVSYLPNVQAPTLLVQGQADTLFNLNEATATYKTLKAQGTTAKMIWQSWGHSGGLTDPASGELNLSQGNLETSYVGKRILAWFDRYLHGDTGVDTGPAFAYYRDWITDPDSTYATASQVPALSRTLYLSGDGKLVDDRKKVSTGSRGYRNRLVPTSHSESSLAGLIGLPDPAPYDTAGTYLAWTSESLTAPVEVVGAPEVTLEVGSRAAERVQHSGNAADKLVLFAKLYDVAPDGTRTLVHRLVAPVRVPDVTKPFTVSLPGIVHRYEAGHRLRFVVAASDDAYFGNRGVKPVTVSSTSEDTGVLRLPVVGS
jgi:putative CocE/NonD family hydrolase